MNRTWLEPWNESSDPQKWALLAQLHRNLTRRHPLFGLKLEAIGRRFGTDDVLFKTHTGRLVVVGLSRPKAPDENNPKIEFYGSWAEFSRQKMVPDSATYG